LINKYKKKTFVLECKQIQTPQNNEN